MAQVEEAGIERLAAYGKIILQLGEVVTDNENKDWVFLGWGVNTVSKFAIFAQSLDEKYLVGSWGINLPVIYTVVYYDTLIKKFPELK